MVPLDPVPKPIDHVLSGAPDAPALADRAGTLSYAAAFPQGYRSRSDATEAADDILRLSALESDADRAARLFARPGEIADRLHLKIYRTGGLVPLSDVVPVLENFGFVVLEEVPTALDGGKLGHIHEFGFDSGDLLLKLPALLGEV